MRGKVLERLAFLGVALKGEAKKGEISCITQPGSAVRAYVIPANEELGIARRTMELIRQGA